VVGLEWDRCAYIHEFEVRPVGCGLWYHAEMEEPGPAANAQVFDMEKLFLADRQQG
jgi:hypothetical protein